MCDQFWFWAFFALMVQFTVPYSTSTPAHLSSKHVKATAGEIPSRIWFLHDHGMRDCLTGFHHHHRQRGSLIRFNLTRHSPNHRWAPKKTKRKKPSLIRFNLTRRGPDHRWALKKVEPNQIVFDPTEFRALMSSKKVQSDSNFDQAKGEL